MGETTNIEWYDATLNLWWGSTKDAWGPGGKRQEVKSWGSTLENISKRANNEGRRFRVLCQSISDMFEGPESMGGLDSENWKLVSRLQDDLFEVIAEHPELDFLLLTKRPENVLDVVYRHDDCDTPEYNWTWPDNLWIGTSVEDQKTADERIPELLKIPAAVRFLSCEPLLGPVKLPFDYGHGTAGYDDHSTPITFGIHWVIAGGESGPNARPMHPDWARSLRDQCEAAGVPFYFNGWGEWWPVDVERAVAESIKPTEDVGVRADGSVWKGSMNCSYTSFPDTKAMWKIGKARSGRLLDWREWSQFPEVTP